MGVGSMNQPAIDRIHGHHGSGDCLGRVPYASLIAFILTVVGVGLFCGMCYQAFNATIDQARKLNIFQNDIPWLDKVQLTFILIAVIMSLLALILLIVGFLATGSTRDKIYSGWRARLGGRISCAFLLMVAYLCNLCWLFIFAVLSCVTFCYMLARGLCSSSMLAENGGGGGFSGRGPPGAGCLDLTPLAPLLNSTGGGVRPEALKICGQDLNDFCQSSKLAYDWYTVGFFACLLIIVSLVHFLICLSANYAHIKDGFKYYELEEIRNSEENELMATYGQHSVYRG